jgi:uncharacterized protein (DUF2336 family)
MKFASNRKRTRTYVRTASKDLTMPLAPEMGLIEVPKCQRGDGMATALTQSLLTISDVERLLISHSPQSRLEIAYSLAKDFKDTTISPLRRAMLCDIIRMISVSISAQVKAALAEELKNYPDLPKDLALTMAKDVMAVSLPILKTSVVLDDSDLIEIINTQDRYKQQAIAQRSQVSSMVAGVLIEKGDRDVVVALTANRGCAFTEQSLLKIVDTYPKDDKITENLIFFHELPLSLVDKLLNLAADNLKEHLIARYPAAEATVQRIVQQSIHKQLLNFVTEGAYTSVQIAALIEQMHAQKRLTNSFLLRSICSGATMVFEHSAACLLRLPVANIEKIMREGGSIGLSMLSTKLKLPDGSAAILENAQYLAAETARNTQPLVNNNFRQLMRQRVLTSTTAMPEQDINILLEELGTTIPC